MKMPFWPKAVLFYSFSAARTLVTPETVAGAEVTQNDCCINEETSASRVVQS